MSSVRDRLEREQQQRELPTPAKPRSHFLSGGNGPTSSSRELAEARDFEASPERLQPIDKHRATGLSSFHSPTVTGVRSRLDQQRAVEEAKSERPDRTAVAEFYLAEHYREEAVEKQREIDEQRKQQERAAKEKAIERANARILSVNFVLDQAPGGPPSPDERRRVLAALKKFPDSGPEKALSILLVLRGDI